MWNLLLQIIAGILSLWLADKFVPGVDFTGPIFPQGNITLEAFTQTLVFVGGLLGCLNFFVKPILKTITFPLAIITLNLFSLVIAMGLVWTVDIFSPELIINGLVPLFWTTVINWGANLLFNLYKTKTSGS